MQDVPRHDAEVRLDEEAHAQRVEHEAEVQLDETAGQHPTRLPPTGLAFHSQSDDSGGMAPRIVRPARRVGARELVPLLAGWSQARGPGYAALAERLRLLVLDGRLPVDVVLPSERELAVALGTSRTTTAGAYRALRESGFAAAGQGAGTWTALPGGDSARMDDLPWPVQTSGVAGTADGRGDMASAAPEAPPQVHGAYAAALAELPRYLPGHGYVSAGLPALRERVAARFTARGLATTPEQVLVTSGAVHGLRLVLDALLAPGDRVLVESPSYPLALDAIRRAGGRPVALPVEARRLGRERRAGRRPRHRGPRRLPHARLPQPDGPPHGRSDPAGPSRRRSPGRGARRSSTRRPSISTCAARAPRRCPLRSPRSVGTAVTLGSASKTFWGGLRVGWVRADARLVKRLTLARAVDDLGSPLVEQLATAHLLDVADEVLSVRRPELLGRSETLRAAVARAPARVGRAEGGRRALPLVPAAGARQQRPRGDCPRRRRDPHPRPPVRAGRRLRGAAAPAVRPASGRARGGGRPDRPGLARPHRRRRPVHAGRGRRPRGVTGQGDRTAAV